MGNINPNINLETTIIESEIVEGDEVSIEPVESEITDNTDYDSLTIETPTETVLKLPNILSKGTEFNVKIKKLAGNDEPSTTTVNENITAISKAASLPEQELGKDNILSLPNTSNPLYIWYDNGTIYYYTESTKVYLTSEVTYMFANLVNLKSIDLSIFDTSQVMYMSYMFYNCSSLSTIDMSNFDLSKIKSAHAVFQGTNVLVSLKTPMINSSVEILLPKPLYDSTGNEYTKLTSAITESILLETKTKTITGQYMNERMKKLAANSVYN